MYELRRHIYGNTVDRSTIKKLVNKFFPRCECLVRHKNLQNRRSLLSLCDGGMDIDCCQGNNLLRGKDEGESLEDEQSGMSEAGTAPTSFQKGKNTYEFCNSILLLVSYLLMTLGRFLNTPINLILD